MAKLKGKAKDAFLRRMNRGRRKAGLRAIQRKNPGRGRRKARARRGGRARRALGAVVAVVAKKVRRRRSGNATNPRRRRRRQLQGGTVTMAKKRRSRGARKRRGGRGRRPAVVLINGKKRHHRRRRNPSFSIGATVREVTKALLPGFIGGGVMGFIDSKFLGDKALPIQVLGKLALAGAAGAILRKKPAMAYAAMGAVLGAQGYGFGVRFGGGVVAASKATGMQELAQMARNDQYAMGLLVQQMNGMGLLTQPQAGMGDANGMPDLAGNETDDALATAMRGTGG